MKKIRKVLSLLIILGICISLCGCNQLDELRASRAIATEKGTIILSDGSEYKALPECEELSPDFFNGDTVYVVEEEVPLLLTTFSNTSFFKSNDGIFLQSYQDVSNIFYCRTDVYDSILERINDGFTGEDYGYWYYDYEKDEEGFYKLKSDQADAIQDVLTNQKGEQLPFAAAIEYECFADLWLCTGDKLFMRDTVDICVVEGKYYVADNGFENITFYSVPDELSDVFKEILKKQIECDSYWETVQ